MALPGASKRHSKKQTEFGGKDGVIQAAEDGHSLTIGEQAHVLRTHNMWNNDNDFYVIPGEVALENAQSGWQEGTRVEGSNAELAASRVAGRTIDEVDDVENLA